MVSLFLLLTSTTAMGETEAHELNTTTPYPNRLAFVQFGPGGDASHSKSGKLGPAIAEKPAYPLDVPPPPKTAISKGSFTVWINPPKPKPGQKYTIYIQVKVPKSLKRYPIKDLTGSIVGTDGYKDYFGGPLETGTLPVKNQRVRFPICNVPGAQGLVRDVIRVKSRILKESCEIKMQF